jgi:rSAM/selenodomain-associated transferase 2
MDGASISIIIPTLNEAEYLPRTLASIRRSGNAQVLVVDGGSTDGTRCAAAPADRVLQVAPGRSRQMNRGALAARGDILLFLHADTTLHHRSLDEIRMAMRDSRLIGGSFHLRIDSARPTLRVVAWMSNVRSRLFGLSYGDQGIFVRRDVFEAMGGFAELAIMEDFEFVRRLCARGRLAMLRSPASTSGRRWETHGVLRTTLANWVVQGMYAAGVRHDRIRRLYDAVLAPSPTRSGTAP